MAFDVFNIHPRSSAAPLEGHTTLVQPERALRRILSFTGRTIDDVVNDPIAKSQVLGYYKLHKWVERESEISELERQWNDLPRRVRR